MSKKSVVWLAILGFLLLAIYCICTKKNKIEDDIRTRALTSIENIDGFDGEIEVDGRNIILNGTVPTKELGIKIEQLLGSEYGVCKVINNLDVSNYTVIPHEKRQRIQAEFDKLIELENIEFESNTAVIVPVSYGLIDKAARILSENPNISVEIRGHTDSQGNEEYNLGLSNRRAEAVLSQLVERGIARDRLSAKGYGSSLNIADNSTELGRQKNRRVEFKIEEDK